MFYYSGFFFSFIKILVDSYFEQINTRNEMILAMVFCLCLEFLAVNIPLYILLKKRMKEY